MYRSQAMEVVASDNITASLAGGEGNATTAATGLAGKLQLLLFLFLWLFAIPFATYVLWSVFEDLVSPLRKYPGPWLAKWTRFWYMYQNWTGNSHLELDRLHKKYGPVVRITPGIIDIDIPEMIHSIFNTKGDWLKTSFYHVNSVLVNGQIVLNLFSETDPKKHARVRKPVAKFYSPSSITATEPHIDRVIVKFCDELERRFIDAADEEREFDLGRWVLFYTWDVVGAVTFSRRFGYLDQGRDFDETLATADKALDYFVVVGVIPFLDHLFDKNPLYRIGPPSFTSITEVAMQRLQERYAGADGDYHDPQVPDFLDRFIEAKNDDPENITDGDMVAWQMINLVAGADTTAITIRTALYHSIRDRRIWHKLTEAVSGANLGDNIPPAYKEARAIPYVDAVVREALRYLPGVAMSMERHVPPGGATLPNGDFLPGGTIVGYSPYIANRNKSVFGDDADDFRPERWLRDEEGSESETDFQARLTRMNKADLSFGGGSRNCLGQHMGLFQAYKVVTTLVARYEIELSEKAHWKVTNSWFPRQEGLRVRMKRRT